MDSEFEDDEFTDDEFTDSETESDGEFSKAFPPTCGLCRLDVCTDDNDGALEFDEKSSWATAYESFETHTFHGGCIELAGPDLMRDQQLKLPDPGVYNATILEPFAERRFLPPTFTKRRLNWLKKTFSEDLCQILNYRLPREVCDNIAQYCLRDRAVQVIRNHWLRKDRPEPGLISIAMDGNSLWAQYVEFEGIRYVKSLSYHSLGGDESQVLSNPDPDCNVNIFIAHNYLGVTEIIATPNGEIPSVKEEPGRWWTIFIPSRMPFYLKARCDGIKLRELSAYNSADEPKYPKYPHDLRWSVLPTTLDPIPEPPIPCDSWPDGEVISAIDWNQSDVIGYSFYVWDSTIMKIIPHKIGEKHPYNFIAPVQYRYSWVYFPIDPGERISEVWIRRYGVNLVEESSRPAATLILRTSKGRLLTLGPQLKYQQPEGYKTHAKYDLIATMPQKHPCRMYFANWNANGSWMRFEGASTCPRLSLDACYNKALELHPDNGKYQYSSAELDGVRTVTPCGSWRDRRPDAILGLLLTYQDGRKRCVGQVRLDFLLDPIEVTSDTMWISYPETDEISWCAHDDEDEASGVDLISFEGPGEFEEPYIKIPMRGRLDWYFSERQCHLSHRDDTNPLDEFLKLLPQEAAPGMPRPGHVVKPVPVLVGRGMNLMEGWNSVRRQGR